MRMDLIRMRGIIILSDLPMTKSTLRLCAVIAATIASVATVRLTPDQNANRSVEQDWPFYGGDQGGTKYSPIVDINRETVARLGPAWEWLPREKALPEFGTRPGAFEVPPLVVGNALYL